MGILSQRKYHVCYRLLWNMGRDRGISAVFFPQYRDRCCGLYIWTSGGLRDFGLEIPGHVRYHAELMNVAKKQHQKHHVFGWLTQNSRFAIIISYSK